MQAARQQMPFLVFAGDRTRSYVPPANGLASLPVLRSEGMILTGGMLTLPRMHPRVEDLCNPIN